MGIPYEKEKWVFRAWIIWLLSALFMFYKYAIEVSPSVMTSDLMREFSLTGAQMGNLAASYFYAYLIFQIPAGLLIDRWGPRRTTTGAIVVCALGTALLSSSLNLEIALLGRFLAGAGASFAAINCLKLIANWFPVRRFAFMAGLMMSVGMLGAVGGQAPLSHFISLLGWRSALFALAVGGVVLALLFVLIVKDKAPGHPALDWMPEKPRVMKNLQMILRNRQAWALSFYSGLAFAPISAFGGLWGVPFLREVNGFTQAAATKGSSLIFIGFAIGAPLFGWISDLLGKRRPVMAWGTVMAAGCLGAVLYFPQPSVALMYSALFLFGFSISAFLLCFTMIKEIHFPVVAATAIGFMNAFDALFGAFSDPLTGKILDLFWTGEMEEGARLFGAFAYHLALGLLLVYLVLSLIFLAFIRESHCKQAVPAALP